MSEINCPLNVTFRPQHRFSAPLSIRVHLAISLQRSFKCQSMPAISLQRSFKYQISPATSFQHSFKYQSSPTTLFQRSFKYQSSLAISLHSSFKCQSTPEYRSAPLSMSGFARNIISMLSEGGSVVCVVTNFSTADSTCFNINKNGVPLYSIVYI